MINITITIIVIIAIIIIKKLVLLCKGNEEFVLTVGSAALFV